MQRNTIARRPPVTTATVTCLDVEAQPQKAIGVVGTYQRVRSGRSGLGGLADALLHASPVAVGDNTNDRGREWTLPAEQHAANLIEMATATLPAECPVTSAVGQGESLEDAEQGLKFADTEVVMIGSSRLAQPRRIFLGHSASKTIRELPVPMIGWPRDWPWQAPLGRRYWGRAIAPERLSGVPMSSGAQL